MTPFQWLSIAISLVIMITGTAANLFIIGRFVGRHGEALKHMAGTLGKVEERVEENRDITDKQISLIEERVEIAHTKLGLVDVRLVQAEVGLARFWEMRDEFVSLRVTVELTNKQNAESLGQIHRGQSVIERQLANLVSTRIEGGFMKMSSEDTNR